jgi:hypothetical protein
MKRLFVAALLTLAPLAANAAIPPYDETVEHKLQPQIETLLGQLVKEGRTLSIDGMPVFNGKDKFLPGKIAISLVEFLTTLAPDDPRLPPYLEDFKKVARLTVDDANDSWGAYYYVVALDKLREAGLLERAIDRLTLAKLRVHLDWRMFVDPDNFDLIDHPNNYYVVAFGIARMRMRMGWEDGAGAAKIYDKIVDHYHLYSGEFGFADETDGEGRFDRYSVLLSAEFAHHFIECGDKPPPELLGWVRKSADVMLARLHKNGAGFEYGRSLGPYSETAIIEVLTTAAALGVLTEPEKMLAYSYVSRAAQRYFEFWVTQSTGSVNLWDDGRRTDLYRGKFRILGENLSLAHQYAYTNEMWNKMGFKNRAPLADFTSALDARPKESVTWFAKGAYDRLLLTRRDEGHIIGLPVISGGATQHMNSPYFPIPYSRGMIAGVADGTNPLMVAQFTLADGSVLMPLAYFREVKLGKNEISWRQSEMDRMGGTAPVPDERLAVETRYQFAPGKIIRTDRYTPKAPIEIKGIRMDFAGFGNSTFTAEGLDKCQSQTIDKEADYESDEGPMTEKIICTSGPRTLSAPFTLSWTLTYRP